MYLLGTETTTIDGVGNGALTREAGSLKSKPEDLEAGGAVASGEST